MQDERDIYGTFDKGTALRKGMVPFQSQVQGVDGEDVAVDTSAVAGAAGQGLKNDGTVKGVEVDERAVTSV